MTNRRNWEKSEVDFLRANYTHCKLINLAGSLNRTESSVKTKATLLGLRKEPVVWTEAEKKILVSLYPTRSNNYLSGLLGRTPAAIRRFANEVLGLKKTKESFSIICSESFGSYRSDFFSSVDTGEKAYLLGYIIGDGNICDKKCYKLTIVSHIQDIEVIYFFQHYLGKGSLHFPEQKDYLYYYLNSYGVIRSLMNLGVLPNKTKSVCIPRIPPILMPHLVRGLFDSDGCITLRKNSTKKCEASITGNYHVCYFLKDYVSKVLNVKGSLCHSSQNDTVWTWALGGKPQLRKFYQFLYKDATLFLARKHNKFVEAGLHHG